jgi:hypothetical protein
MTTAHGGKSIFFTTKNSDCADSRNLKARIDAAGRCPQLFSASGSRDPSRCATVSNKFSSQLYDGPLTQYHRKSFNSREEGGIAGYYPSHSNITRNLLVVQIKEAALSNRKLTTDSAWGHLSSPLLRYHHHIHQNNF